MRNRSCCVFLHISFVMLVTGTNQMGKSDRGQGTPKQEQSKCSHRQRYRILLQDVHFKSFLNFIFLMRSGFKRERHREWGQDRGLETGIHRIQSRLQVLNFRTHPYAGIGFLHPEIMTWTKFGHLADWAIHALHKLVRKNDIQECNLDAHEKLRILQTVTDSAIFQHLCNHVSVGNGLSLDIVTFD